MKAFREYARGRGSGTTVRFFPENHFFLLSLKMYYKTRHMSRSLGTPHFLHTDYMCTTTQYVVNIMTLKNQHFRVRFGEGGGGNTKEYSRYAFINVDNCERPLTHRALTQA